VCWRYPGVIFGVIWALFSYFLALFFLSPASLSLFTSVSAARGDQKKRP
jgi:hypothetical protein